MPHQLQGWFLDGPPGVALVCNQIAEHDVLASFHQALANQRRQGWSLVPDALIRDGAVAPSVVIPGEPDTARAELGLALDTLLMHFCMESTTYHGYTYECVATPAEPDAPWASEAPKLYWNLIWVSPTTAVMEYILSLVLWRRRLYCDGIRLYIEGCWSPTTGETLALKGLEKDTRLQSMRQAHKGITLLKAIETGGGRRRGSTAIPEAQFRQRYPAVYKECGEAYTTPPKRYEIAEALGISTDTFDRYLADYGLPFPPF